MKHGKDKKHEEKNGVPPAADCECSCGGEGAKASAETASKEKEYYDQLLRLKADFENYRKRIEKEKPELIKWGKAELLSKLLPLYDLLLQAHLHIAKVQESPEGLSPAQAGELMKGLEMIFKEFSKTFENEGIRPMETAGKPYDPMSAEIMGMVETGEEQDGLVVDELQKGFYYGDKVLRPARVRIGRKKAEAKPAAEEPAESDAPQGEQGLPQDEDK
ncbi:MAG TPA: nucleotide exchange factor GrpE [Elusimicrobia bacterium]|jgi:molecular chaperone GrpE|nr:nucleotide exchange factor GrpE [Elusimicrobiota bacterium]